MPTFITAVLTTLLALTDCGSLVRVHDQCRLLREILLDVSEQVTHLDVL